MENQIKVETTEFLYIRLHQAYDFYEACKLGITKNIPDRDSTYATGEIERGIFSLVIKLENEKAEIIEKKLHEYFNHYHIIYKPRFCEVTQRLGVTGGSEFYKKEIIPQIIPYLQQIGILFKVLSREEIDNLIRCYRIRKSNPNPNKKVLKIVEEEEQNASSIFIPREDQQITINKGYTHLQTHDKGTYVITCGGGKTLISLWTTQKLQIQTILIGVPNILLLNQWKEITDKLFTIPCLKVSGIITTEQIQDFIQKNREKCIVITTYASSFKVFNATESINFQFGMKINDECHHLTTKNMFNNATMKSFIQMHQIKSIKQISLTATLKLLESDDENIENEIVSNNNIKYFGKIMDKISLTTAIKNENVCDYLIQTIVANEEQLEQMCHQFNIYDENDKRLFLAAFVGLKSIFDNYSHHLLVYANETNNIIKINQYIRILLKNGYFNFEEDEIYYSEYHSNMTLPEQQTILRNYNTHKYGIISCVYCLGEGYDNCIIDGEVFAENMTSTIRVVQSALRGGRKNPDEPNKINKLICPILNIDDFFEGNNNSDLKKTKEIIYQMGLEDETIEYKIKVFNINIQKHDSKKDPTSQDPKSQDDIFEYNDELTKKIRLKTVKRTSIGINYEKARKIIAENNVQTKEDYFKLCKIDNRLSPNPESNFIGRFTTWIEYLSIERIYYDLETCKNKVMELLILYPDLKKNNFNLFIINTELCKLDKNFPPNGLWVEYYNINSLQDIIIISKKKKLGIIL